MAEKPDLQKGFLSAFAALPIGEFRGDAQGKTYVVVKSEFAGGRSQKLVAEELGGADYISMNLYRTRSSTKLFPCEMPARKVIDFVINLRPHL